MIIDETSQQYPPEKGQHAPRGPQPPQTPTFMVWGSEEQDEPAPPSYDDSVSASPSTFTFSERWEGSSTGSHSGPSHRSVTFSAYGGSEHGGSSHAGGASVQRNTTVLSTTSSHSSSSSSHSAWLPAVAAPNTAYASSAYAPAPPPEGGVSDVASITNSTFTDDTRMLRNFSPSASVAEILNPPPQPFFRAPLPHLPYEPFHPMALMSRSSKLEKGFPQLPPPIYWGPHPFCTHDVNEQDWARFLADVKAIAVANPINKLLAGVTPAVRNMKMPLGVLSPISFAVNMGLDAHAKSRRKGPVGELIDLWNHHFFHPRRIQVTLAQGKFVYSGPDSLPADMAKPEHGAHIETFQDDSDSEEESNPSTLGNATSAVGNVVGDALQKRRQWKQAQRERKREKQMYIAKSDKWRLVVSPKQYVL